MSHVTTMEIQTDDAPLDLEALRLAAELSGGEFLENQTTYQCYPGGWMGDSPPPEGWDPSMWGKCEHAIRYPGCEYEVGIVKLNGKYQFAWDYWSSGGLFERLGGATAPVLEKAAREAAVQIHQVREVERRTRSLGNRIVRRQPLRNGGVALVVEVRG